MAHRRGDRFGGLTVLIKCDNGMVVAEGTGKELLIDLACILRSLEENGFPEEGVDVAVKLARESILHGIN